MRLSRFLSVIFFITGLCLLHVYQQTEIFRYAYAGQKKLGLMQDLLDKNVVLRYNIEKNTSLVRIGDKISEDKDFEMPDSYRLVRLKNPVCPAVNRPVCSVSGWIGKVPPGAGKRCPPAKP